MKNRRQFIKNSLLLSAGFAGMSLVSNNSLLNAKGKNKNPNKINSGYGKLMKDPEGIFDLPKGFSYKIITKSGEKMSDGLLSPGKNDAMATFPLSDNKILIVRNHEMSYTYDDIGAFGKGHKNLNLVNKSNFYDYNSGKSPSLGGTTTLVYNLKTGVVEKEYMSLFGTERNCAGGITPWGTWISCEESNLKRDKNHGYCFEVLPSEDINVSKPKPIEGMGRFMHEAIAVDPNTGIVYLTEDQGDGLIYRFIPNVKEQLHKGGKLQALAIRKKKSYDTRNWNKKRIKVGERLETYWIDLKDVHSPNDDLKKRGRKDGAAVFARGEGMWWGENEVYFCCTNGGKAQAGQIFKYIPSRYEGSNNEENSPGILELFVESNNKKDLDQCDNLTVAPWGDLIVCEDKAHPRLMGVTKDGSIYKFADSVKYRSELTGVCFSPEGSTMFVNIQHVGLTLAITGPWKI